MTLGQALVICGDARRLPLPDASVDLVVTSPPFYSLRDYGYDGQIGSEPTWQEWLGNLLECTREWVRVLKPEGSIFVDCGDVYATRYSSVRGRGRAGLNGDDDTRDRTGQNRSGIREKSLMLLPERYRVACVDELGLVARAVIVWDKPSALPESVRDRVRRSHEDWVHLTRQPRYYSAVDEIREPHTGRRDPKTYRRTGVNGADPDQHKWGRRESGSREYYATETPDGRQYNPLGKLPGSVWEIPSEPLRVPEYYARTPTGLHWLWTRADAWRWMRQHGVYTSAWPRDDTRHELRVAPDHYAAFPSAWPRRIIAGWSPPGICTECGEGRRPVVHRDRVQTRRGVDSIRGENDGSIIAMSGGKGFGQRAETTATITGYACACTPYTDHEGTGERHRNGDHPSGGNAGRNVNAGTRLSDLGSAERVGPWREYHFDGWTPPPTRPSVVLDPMGGTGTTALAAKALGRVGVTVDLSGDYARLARWRTTDRGELARVLGVPKPPKPIEGQLTFGGDAA